MCKTFHYYSMCAHVVPSEACQNAHITKFQDLFGNDKVIVIPCHLEKPEGETIADTCPACTKILHGCGHFWMYNNKNGRQFETVTVETRTKYCEREGKCPECVVLGK